MQGPRPFFKRPACELHWKMCREDSRRSTLSDRAEKLIGSYHLLTATNDLMCQEIHGLEGGSVTALRRRQRAGHRRKAETGRLYPDGEPKPADAFLRRKGNISLSGTPTSQAGAGDDPVTGDVIPQSAMVSEQPQEKARGHAPDVSVVVPAKGRPEVLMQCLEALAEQTLCDDRYEVLVVPNGLEREQRASYESIRARAEVLLDRRLRWAEIPEASIPRARNAGIRLAVGRVIVQINQDTILGPNALRQHWCAHEQSGFDPQSVVVGGRRFPFEYRSSLLNCLYEDIPLYTPLHEEMEPFVGTSPKWCVTCNLSALQETFFRYGTFDPDFCWASDTELGERWSSEGNVRFRVSLRIKGYHHHWLSFDSYRKNCIKRAPYICKLGQGIWPSDASEKNRRAVEQWLDSCDFDVESFEQEMRDLEERFRGAEEFSGAVVRGSKVDTVAAMASVLRPAFAMYKEILVNREILRLTRQQRPKAVAVR